MSGTVLEPLERKHNVWELCLTLHGHSGLVKGFQCAPLSYKVSMLFAKTASRCYRCAMWCQLVWSEWFSFHHLDHSTTPGHWEWGSSSSWRVAVGPPKKILQFHLRYLGELFAKVGSWDQVVSNPGRGWCCNGLNGLNGSEWSEQKLKLWREALVQTLELKQVVQAWCFQLSKHHCLPHANPSDFKIECYLLVNYD